MEAVSPDEKTGTVMLSFVVKSDGSLADFKVTNSLSPAADQKAIQLVKNGCAWAGNADKQAKEVNLTVEFHKL